MRCLPRPKTLSALTQRMLLVPSNRADMVIRAINKADINACLVTPFADQDLVSQAGTCLEAFGQNRKIERLKRVTVHQNKKMFQIAQKLKKKDKLFQERISEKKAEILLLRSKLKTPGKEMATLAQRFQSLGMAMESRVLKKEFLSLADYILALFDSGAAKAGLDREGGLDMSLPSPGQEEGTTPSFQEPQQAQALTETVIKAAPGIPGRWDSGNGERV